eukprot:gb/GECG01002431.1/.p1 GENE.gb/GECG01002431.1/~~gb/GECG01002431.1/.p1  ORF type:complete len:552 (+),score=47.31 gb/GECG01002431.1/:1-1656(+)
MRFTRKVAKEFQRSLHTLGVTREVVHLRSISRSAADLRGWMRWRSSRADHCTRSFSSDECVNQGVLGNFTIVNLPSAIDGTKVTIQGWVRSVRIQKKVAFMTVNDGSCHKNLQVVAEPAMLRSVSVGCSVKVTGVLKDINAAKGHIISKEIHLDGVDLVGSSDASIYPLQKKAHSLEFLRDIMHLRARSNTIASMMRIRNCLSNSIHQFFQQNEFIHVHTPIITSNDCEGAGELFRVTTEDTLNDKSPMHEFFGTPAHLTVSGQLHAEMFALSLSRVYTFGPTFRAENSNTSRHLAEFWMVEPEVAFASLQDIMRNAEACLKFSLQSVLEQCAQDLEFFSERYDSSLIERLQLTTDSSFAQLTYTEVINILQNKANAGEVSFETMPRWGEGLATEHEKYIAEHYTLKPAFITDYPAKCKPFYMLRNDVEKEGDIPWLEHDTDTSCAHTVSCMDLVVPRLAELIGGSAREHRFQVLEHVMKHHGLVAPDYDGHSTPSDSMKGLEWYLDLRRFGTVPHAGWGLGFERLVQFATGLENIRDVIPVPRVPGSCKL